MRPAVFSTLARAPRNLSMTGDSGERLEYENVSRSQWTCGCALEVHSGLIRSVDALCWQRKTSRSRTIAVGACLSHRHHPWDPHHGGVLAPKLR